MPRRLVIMMVVGLLAAAAVAAAVAINGNPAFGAVIFVLACVGAMLNAWMMKRGRRIHRAGASLRRGEESGRRLQPVDGMPLASAPERSWAGGGNVATEIGRMNATWPLAVLTVTGQTLALRFRPRLIARLFSLGPVIRWQPGELSMVYPVRGRISSLNRGIAIECADRPIAYFWTMQPQVVLSDLAARGMPIDWTERFIRLWR